MSNRAYMTVTPGVCQVCGCTWETPCPGGCSWANEEETLCSACDPLLEPLTPAAMRMEKGYQLHELTCYGNSLRYAASDLGIPYTSARRYYAAWIAQQDACYQQRCDEQAEEDLARIAAGEDPGPADVPF